MVLASWSVAPFFRAKRKDAAQRAAPRAGPCASHNPTAWDDPAWPSSAAADSRPVDVVGPFLGWARRSHETRCAPPSCPNIFCESTSALAIAASSLCPDSNLAPHCHASVLPPRTPGAVATPARLSIARLNIAVTFRNCKSLLLTSPITAVSFRRRFGLPFPPTDSRKNSCLGTDPSSRLE